MKKILIAILFFIFGFIIFMPKINLLYTLEDLLSKEHIEIQESSLKDRLLDLNLKDVSIYYDGIESVIAKELTISPWIFFNSIKIYDVKPSSTLKNILNIKADKVNINYSVFHYKVASLEADGDFGKIHGNIDLIKREVHLVLDVSESFKSSKFVKKFFKKREEGLVYESKF